MIRKDDIPDVQKALEAWGGWSAAGKSHLDWRATASGFKGISQVFQTSRPSCSDDLGLLIDGFVARLKTARPEEYRLIVLHFILNQPKRQIARLLKMDEKQVRVKIFIAESFISGCISMLEERRLQASSHIGRSVAYG